MADNLDIGASNTTSNPYAMAGIGIAGGMLSNYMGMNNQQNLNSQQLQNQMQLNEQMQQIQQENWDYTNYENQVKHLERAGLNAGLIYGMGGGGGSTMGGASGGSAQGGQAHQPQFDITANMLQAKQLENQTKVAEATADRETAAANKLRAETPTSGNLGDATYRDITATAIGKEIANAFNSENNETALQLSKQELENKKAENIKLIEEGKISKIEAENRQKKLSAEIALLGIEAKLKKHQIKLTDAQTTAVYEELEQGWEELSLHHDKNIIDFNNAMTNRLNHKLDAILGPANIEAGQRNATKQAISHLAGSILMTGAMTGQFSGSRNRVGY
jgi:hypothetical protein